MNAQASKGKILCKGCGFFFGEVGEPADLQLWFKVLVQILARSRLVVISLSIAPWALSKTWHLSSDRMWMFFWSKHVISQFGYERGLSNPMGPCSSIIYPALKIVIWNPVEP